MSEEIAFLRIEFQLLSDGKRDLSPGDEPKGVCFACPRCCWFRWINNVSISVGSEIDALLWVILVSGLRGFARICFICWNSGLCFSLLRIFLI